MPPPLVSQPWRVYYCDGCLTFQSLDHPCKHVQPPSLTTVLECLLAWGLLLALGVAMWVGVVRLAPIVWQALRWLL